MDGNQANFNSFPLFPSPPPSPLLTNSNWTYLFHGEVDDMQERIVVEEELRHALLCANVELESTRAVAQEQLTRLEVEIAQLRSLLDVTTRERDDARSQSHNASDAVIKNGQKPQCSILAADDAAGIASDSSEGSSIVSSPPSKQAVKGTTELDIGSMVFGSKRELPEKGRLLEAVMQAGPLLQNLLLAGPLPQWRHPPPTLGSFEIPPVSIGGITNNNNINTTATVGILNNEKQDDGQKKKKKKRKEVERWETPLDMENGGSSRSSSSWTVL